jgi:general secretion pathway protein L
VAKLFSVIGGFLNWWWRELSGLVPGRLRRMLRGDRGEAIFCFDGDTLKLSRRVDRQERSLGEIDLREHDARTMARAARSKFGRLDLDRVMTTLRLAPGKALRKSIELPIAAEENLRQVVAFEMDRRTPFKTDDVYYDQQVMSRDTKAGRLTVDLAVAPRKIVDEALERAAEWHLRPDRIEADGAVPRSAEPLNLMPIKPKSGVQAVSALRFALVTAIIGLLLAAVLIPLSQNRVTADRLQEEVTAARASATLVEDLRTELDRLVEGGHSVVDQKATRPLAIAVLDEVTRLLPDTSWVFQLRISDTEVQVYGYSATAAELIALFEKSELLSDAQFRSPVTRDARVGLERFHLSAQIRDAVGS